MATKDVKIELDDILMPAAHPGPIPVESTDKEGEKKGEEEEEGKTREEVASREPGKEANVPEDPNEGSQEVSPETVVQDDENTAGGHETPAADPSGRTPEDVLEDLFLAVMIYGVEAFNQHLAELARLLQDDSAVVERLTAIGALCWAARVCSTPMMDTLIKKGVDINSKSRFWDSETPLHVAARHGRADTVRHLIDKGADVNIKDIDGRTPLHMAAEWGGDESVRYLVDKGADVNVKDDGGNAPLHLAAMKGKSDIVRCLIDSGAHVNIRDHLGTTPLHMATKNHHEDTVKFLAAHGADVNIKDGEDALGNLKKAIQGGDVESFNSRLVEVEEIFQDKDSTASGLTVSGALCYAAWVGSTPMMDTLIEKGVGVNTKSSRVVIDGREAKWIPLHVAARSGRVDTMIHLIGKGADVNIKMNNGWIPLHAAASGGKVNTVKYFVEKGANVNSEAELGITPLHLAAEHGSVGVVSYLIEKGGDVNIKDYRRETPLHKAASEGNADAMSCLVDKGADVNIKSRNGETPLHKAASEGNADAMSCLVDKGADVNIKDDNGWTPLHVAAYSITDDVDTVSYLVDKGADVNIKNDDGWTPLRLAAGHGSVGIVSYLVDKGADVNIKDDDGNTPIHKACRFGNAETVKSLLEKGADPTAKNNDGWNSLTFAIDSRNKDSAALLLDCKGCEMLRSSFRGTTLMRKLIVLMPDVAEMAFNKCVTTNEGKARWADEVHATSNTFEVEYNYEFLEDFEDRPSSDSSEPSSSAESWRPKKFTKKDHPLNLMTKHGCSNLLKHPLVISLLEHKWTRFGRYIFFGNLFLYLIFLTFLTAFGLVVLSPVETTCIDVFNGSFNGTAPGDCKGLSIHEYRFLYVGAAVTILTALLRLALEIFQLRTHPLEYLLDWVNWLEIPLYLFSIIFTFVFATPCLCVYSWQWQIGVVAVFLGWVGLITFLQKLPATGVYVLMFVKILGSFMKIAFLALLLVIAFAFAFYMLLFDPAEMRTPFSHAGRAVVKVMAMTTGEIDFDELYHQQEGEDEIAFPVLSFLFWIIFLVLMPVLLSNLLVGLAVGDVDRLQKAASENRIKLQIDLVLSFEELLESLGVRHRFVIKSKTHYPNVPVTLLPQWCKKRGVSDFDLVYNAKHYDTGRLGKVRRWFAKRYSKVWITDEYSTSGVRISDAIKPPLEPLEKQLQNQRQDLQAQLQKQSEQIDTKLSEQIDTKLQKQSKQFETKLEEQLEVKVKEQNEHQSDKLEVKLKEYSEKQFQEAVRQFSEYHKEQAKQSEEQAKRMEEQAKQSEEQAKKMEEQAKRMEEQAKRMEEQAKQSEEQAKRRMDEHAKQSVEQAERMKEQAKKAEEKTEQLAGEVASLREALEKLVAQMTVK